MFNFKRGIAAAVLGFSAIASAYAEIPVRLIVAFPPGGPVDLVARVIAEPLGKALGRSVIVENRPGANGNIAAAYVAKAAPDGSILFFTSVGAVAISPALYDKLPYDPVKDFAPISLVVNNSEVLVVNPANPAVDAADLVKRSLSAKQAVAIGSSGVGSIPHLTLEMFQDSSKANVLHVPYKGAAPVINDVMGNQIGGFFGDVPGLIGHIQGGKLKALGIAAERRHPLLPNVKTLTEQGIPNAVSNNWYGLLAPAGMSPAKVQQLNAAVATALKDPMVIKRLTQFGTEPAASSPAEFTKLIATDRAKWSALIKEKNIRPE
jgi:tripartite-type tricarboxylate transporter receptor subunit TctC